MYRTWQMPDRVRSAMGAESSGIHYMTSMLMIIMDSFYFVKLMPVIRMCFDEWTASLGDFLRL